MVFCIDCDIVDESRCSDPGCVFSERPAVNHRQYKIKTTCVKVQSNVS